MPQIDAAGVAHEFGTDFRAWQCQVRSSSRAHTNVTCGARGYPRHDVSEDIALCPHIEFAARPAGVTAEPLRIGGAQQ
jgi:hypothetical protein